MKLLFKIAIVIALVNLVYQKADGQEVNPVMTKEEQKLYQLITEYRRQNHLPPIPVSKSLTIVAHTHCIDMDQNPADEKAGCNMHSWSDKGKWTPVCYTEDHKHASGMWNKPAELTTYKSAGYEIAFGGSSSEGAYQATATEAFNGWKSSKFHNDVMLNKDIWQKHQWNAMGIGIYKGFAVVWFGEETDTEGAPVIEQ